MFCYKLKSISVFVFCFLAISNLYCDEESPLFWPPPPAEIRVSFVKSVYSPHDTGVNTGFFKKLRKAVFGLELDILNKPVAVAVDREKTIYICDIGEPALHIYIQKKKQYKKITAINNHSLLSPVGVAVSESGLIFIADSKLNKILCLNKDGGFNFAIGADKKFLRPTGLAISKDRLYVVDTLSHNVSVFDLGGNFISKFGARGKDDGKFNYPTAISADFEGKIYVVDTLNFRIQVFDGNNKFLYSLGQLGNSSGSFSRPKGAAVDTFGHIYVTDGMFDNIQIFSQKREFLLSLGESGNKDGEFWILSGIAVDSDNYIYAADSYNQRIQIFRYVGGE